MNFLTLGLFFRFSISYKMTGYSSVVKPILFLGENSSIVKNAIVCSFRIENNLKLIKMMIIWKPVKPEEAAVYDV